MIAHTDPGVHSCSSLTQLVMVGPGVETDAGIFLCLRPESIFIVTRYSAQSKQGQLLSKVLIYLANTMTCQSKLSLSTKVCFKEECKLLKQNWLNVGIAE